MPLYALRAFPSPPPSLSPAYMFFVVPIPRFRCNNRKSDCHPRDLRSIGMHPAKQPRMPTFHELQSAARKYPPRQIHETWEEFLYFESEINFEDDYVDRGVEREGADGSAGSLQLPYIRRRQAEDWTGLK